MRRLNILVWHVHGSYLNSLARLDHTLYLPVRAGRPEGYGGRGATFDLPDNAIEVPADRVADLDLYLVIYQTPRNLEQDGPELLAGRERDLPTIYLEHNTPKPDAVNSQHPFAGRSGLLVHVTRFNALMWDNGEAPVMVIDHAVAIDRTVRYQGDLASGIMIANGIQKRPRIAGYDLFLAARQRVPLDIAGMDTEALGGLGDLPYRELHARMARYRFLYSPMRYTSLPLAVIEAMTLGMPVVTLATTELPATIKNGVHGFISNDPDYLIDAMQRLIDDPALARSLGDNARALAETRFGLDRFRRDWDRAFAAARSLHRSPVAAGVR